MPRFAPNHDGIYMLPVGVYVLGCGYAAIQGDVQVRKIALELVGNFVAQGRNVAVFFGA